MYTGKDVCLPKMAAKYWKTGHLLFLTIQNPDISGFWILIESHSSNLTNRCSVSSLLWLFLNAFCSFSYSGVYYDWPSNYISFPPPHFLHFKCSNYNFLKSNTKFLRISHSHLQTVFSSFIVAQILSFAQIEWGFLFVSNFSAVCLSVSTSPVYLSVFKDLAPKGLCTLYPPSKIMSLFHRSLKQVVNLSCFLSCDFCRMETRRS